MVDIYCRVSTQEQNENGYSIGEQEERLRQYCAAHGWQINDVCIDGGFSGASLNRPAIQKVIADAKEKRIDKVVVYKLDRISRSQKDTLYLIEEIFLKNNVDFVSMSETIDTSTPFGMAMIGILSVFAQLERETIKERMMLGRDARVKSGKYHGTGNNVAGYNYVDGVLTQNEAEAEVVRKIYRMYADGASQQAIAKYLNDIRWRGHYWDSYKIRRLLTQPLYIGMQRWKGENIVVENCPNIITDELYHQVQQQLERKSGLRPQTARNGVSLLGGMIWCGQCGKRYHASVSHGVYRYYCYSKADKKRHVPCNCNNRSWNAKQLDGIVLAELAKIKAVFDNPASFALSTDSSIERELNALEARKKQLLGQQERLIDLYTIGTIDREAVQKRSEAIVQQLAAIDEEAEKLKKPSSKLTPAEVASRMANLNVEQDELKLILHQLIKSITLDGDDVNIIWNFDL